MNEEMQFERPKNRNKKESDMPFSAKFLTYRLFICAIIILILFFISKQGGEMSKNISDFYGNFKKTDMAVSEVLDTFKDAAKETFAPVKNIQNNEIVTGESEKASPDIFYAI